MSGKTITWKDLVFTLGVMDELMKVNTRMIRNMVMGSINGLMAESTKETGP